MSRGLTPSAFRPAITSESDAPPGSSARPGPGFLVDGGAGARHDDGLALGEGVRLDHHRRFLDAQRQVALADGDAVDAHVLAHDDGAGALIDDHAGLALGLDTAMFSIVPSACAGERSLVAAMSKTTVPAVDHLRDRAAVIRVDRLLDALGGGEVRVAQRQTDRRRGR